jgi:hypothetical protein
MKIKTEDCVLAILKYYIAKDADMVLQSGKNWKRVSKKGTNPVVREFHNTLNGTIVVVYSTDTEILKVEEKTENTNDEILKEFSEFPFVYHFKDAIAFSKEEIKDWEFSDCKEDIKEDNDSDYPYKPYSISADTRVGIVDCWEKLIQNIIVFKNKSKYYSRENDGLTTDSIIYFELEKNIHYVPSQEPIDLIENDYENGGGCLLDNADFLKEEVKKYKLNHLLLGV